MHTITKSEGNAEVIDVKWLLARDEDFPSYPRVATATDVLTSLCVWAMIG